MCWFFLLVLLVLSLIIFVIMDIGDWFWCLIFVILVVLLYFLIVGCVWLYFVNEVILWVWIWKNGVFIGWLLCVWKKFFRFNSFLFFVILLYIEIFIYVCWVFFFRSIDLFFFINWNIFLLMCIYFWFMRLVFIWKLDVVKYKN